MLTKIKIDNMQQQQIDPITGIPSATTSSGVQASGFQGGLPAAEDRQTTSQAMGGGFMGLGSQAMPAQPIPANMQGGRSQNFISQAQQVTGQQIFGGQSLPTPMYKMDPSYNGEPGVQKEDFEQFKK